MTNELSERLKYQADRIEKIMNAIKDGKLKETEVDIATIDELENCFEKYEEIIKRQ